MSFPSWLESFKKDNIWRSKGNDKIFFKEFKRDLEKGQNYYETFVKIFDSSYY